MIEISSLRVEPRRSRSDVGPRLHLELAVTLDCELLEGEVSDLTRIADELAAYLERRDQRIGMVAATEWALLIRRARVRRVADGAAPADRIDPIHRARRGERAVQVEPADTTATGRRRPGTPLYRR